MTQEIPVEFRIQRRKVSVPVLPILTAIVVAVTLAMTVRVGRVQSGEVGVIVSNFPRGVEVTLEPGATVYNGLLTDFYVLDNQLKTIRMAADGPGGDEVSIKTRDGSDVTLDVEINYRLVQSEEVIRDEVIPKSGLETYELRQGRRFLGEVEAYQAKWIHDYARSVVRYVFGELATDEFYNADDRDTKAREAETELNRLLNPHGIEVVKVVPDTFRFYEEYEQKIAEKKAADQEVQKQQELARAATEEQKKAEARANAEAGVAIAQAEGVLEKELLAAQAEESRVTKAAEAYKVTTEKAADAEFYKAKNRAQSIVAAAQAEAEGLQRLATALTGPGAVELVKLEYAKALARSRITGLPYATDPRIQKLELSADENARRTGAGGSR